MDFSKIRLNSGKEEKIPEVGGADVLEAAGEGKSEQVGGLRFDRFSLGGVGSLSNVEEVVGGVVEADSSAVTSESLALGCDDGGGVGGDDFGGFLEDLLDDESEFGGGAGRGRDEEEVWDDQLADLLDDDEEESFVVPVVSKNSGVPVSPVVEPVKSLPKSSSLGSNGGAEGSDGGVKRGVRKKARAGKRVRLHGRSSSYRKRKGDLDASMGARGGLEYLVDADGVFVPVKRGKSGADRFSKLVEAAETFGRVKLPEGVGDAGDVVTDGEVKGSIVYPWSTPVEDALVRGVKGRLSSDELGFYRELGVRKSEVLVSDFGRELREPVSGREASVVKKVREGVVRRGVGGHSGYANHGGSAVTLRDQEVLQFLAKFKYATAKQLSNLSGVVERTSYKRLVGLKSKGLVVDVRLWGSAPVWVLTGAGMILSGFDLPLVQANKISYALISHQFVVNNTASNLVGGQANVLHLDDFPVMNRVDSGGARRFGEEVVSETEIQSSFSKMRLLTKASVYRPLILSTLRREFDEWRAGGMGALSPEFMFGNEYMWMLFPAKVHQQVYHAPDLVVKRPRNADGTPESIAVEIELASKADEKYDRVLRVYQADNLIYKKVIWVCKSMQAARSLETVAKAIGLFEEGRIDIVPITTRDGIFEGRDLWTI